jgi:hypothetical protein
MPGVPLVVYPVLQKPPGLKSPTESLIPVVPEF